MISIKLWREDASSWSAVDAWIDTGFNGELVLPESIIERWDLPRASSIDAVLADGSHLMLPTYECVIRWRGKKRKLEVIANQGEHPLLGVGLLAGLDLHISYRTCEVTLK